MDVKSAAAAAGMLGLALAAPASAQTEPPWNGRFLCAADSQKTLEVMQSVRIEVKPAKGQKPDPLLEGLVPFLVGMSREEVREHTAAAEAELEGGYPAWAEAERSAGRTPPSKDDARLAAQEAAKARLAAANEKQSERISEGCQALLEKPKA